MGYAYSIILLGVFIGTKGVSIAVFPKLSEFSSLNEREKFIELIDIGLKLVMTFLVPITVVLLILGSEIVAIFYQRGQFSAEAANLTAVAVISYIGALIALSIGNIISYVYYSLQDTKTPAAVGIIGMFINLIFALVLKNHIGFLLLQLHTP